jgi:hypothetical protein
VNADEDNDDTNRIVIDWRISLGSILQPVFMIIGGVWMFAQLEASVDEDREQVMALRTDMGAALGQLRADVSQTATRLDSRMDAVRDRATGAAR